MIFLTVGHKEFDRLVKNMDEIVSEIDDEVIMQIGDKPAYFPKHAKFFRFVTRGEIDGYFQNTKLIVAHCSTGAILIARKYFKPIIMVPRYHDRGEHIDDHQLELAKILENNDSMRGVFVLYDISKLKSTIQLALHTVPKYEESISKVNLINTIRDYIGQ
ncbi:MAG: glycosyltransferase [Deltaproteobacteria bacterium]